MSSSNHKILSKSTPSFWPLQASVKTSTFGTKKSNIFKLHSRAVHFNLKPIGISHIRAISIVDSPRGQHSSPLIHHVCNEGRVCLRKGRHIRSEWCSVYVDEFMYVGGSEGAHYPDENQKNGVLRARKWIKRGLKIRTVFGVRCL